MLSPDEFMRQRLEADAAKAEAMARVDANANAEWKAFMLDMTRLICLDMAQFTSDDIFDRADAVEDAPKTHDLRAFGPVMRRAARLGYCRKANVAAVASRRRSLHSSPIQVWESLIHAAN